MVVGTAYGVVLALIFALGSLMDIFYITRMIVLVSMLGAGVDIRQDRDNVVVTLDFSGCAS